MSSYLHIADYVAIAFMLTISAGVGVYFRLTGGRQKTTLEFLMADKSMAILPVSFSIMATVLSATSILGRSAETYFYGIQWFMKDISIVLAVLIVSYQILPVYFEMELESLYEYLERRFGTLIKVVISLLYVVQMVLIMPIIIYAPSLALNLVTGISLWTCVILVSATCTFYSTLGGLKAVLWTDLFQGLLMLLTLFALVIKGSLDYGGFHNVFKAAGEGGRLEFFNTSMDFTVRYTLWNTCTQGIIFGILTHGTNFPIIQRLMSCGDLKKAQSSLMWSIPLSFILRLSICLIGVIIYSYYHKCDPVTNKEITSGDQLIILFIMEIFSKVPGLPGLCIAGIISAALSTMSSLLSSLVAITFEDYIKPFLKCRNLKESTATILAKSLVVFYGGLCLFMTLFLASAKGITETASIVYGMVGGPALGIFYLGMFTSTANESGAVAGLIAGAAIGGWIGLGSMYGKPRDPPLPLSTAGCTSNFSDISFHTIYRTNSTSDPEIFNFTQAPNDIHVENRYIFPLYKMSFNWIPAVGFVITVIVGYIISLVVGFFKPKSEVDPRHFCPVIRKWLCKLPEPHVTKQYIELPQSLNQGKVSTDEHRNNTLF